MSYEQILTEVRGRVGIITLNRPDKLNAMSGTMHREMREQIRAWDADDSIGAVVITGMGRAFSSGADMSRFEEAVRGGQQAAPSHPTDREWAELIRESKPVVCALNGVAVGVGITLPLSCDVRVAAEGARFSFRFVRIGLTPKYASTHYLVHLVGLGRALELMLTGRFIEADEAKEIGLVSHVFPPERLLDEAVSLAQQIADNPAWQLGQVKRLVHENYMEKDIALVLEREREIFRQSQATEAHREALIAFRERREPRFH